MTWCIVSINKPEKPLMCEFRMLPENKLIVKDNSLIDASFNLSLVEQRLMLLAIVTAREVNKLTPETAIEISAKDYISQYKVSEATAYETIKEAADSLFNRQFSYHDRYKDTEAISKARWVNKATYTKKLGLVVVNLSAEVISLISRLEAQFTKYMLDQVSDFKSKYSIRLYELVLKWVVTGKTEKYEIEEFRNKIGVTPEEYSHLGDFKKRVIEVAIKEINSKTDIKVELEQFKTGRSVTHFQFKIVKKEKLVKAIELNYKLTTQQIEMFSDLLARHSAFQSHFMADTGEDMENYKKRVRKKLTDEFYVKEWYSFLVAVGFKAKSKR